MPKTLAKRLIIGPFQRFFSTAASGGIVLLGATLLAFFAANSPWREAYFSLWHTPITVQFGEFYLAEDLHFLINEGLMGLFFFLVGLEIKRELLVGELANRRQALYSLLAAVGGMLVPGLIFLAFNPPGTASFEGWGIPVVTDIAFAVGVLHLLGDRVPLSLKVFLIALAIIDDLGAILMIAVFYSDGIVWGALFQAVMLFGLLVLLNRLRIYPLWLYLAFGGLLWHALLLSGIHATLAGVLVALTIPARPRVALEQVYQQGHVTLAHYGERLQITPDEILREHHYLEGIHHLENLSRQAQPPLQRLEHGLHPWVNYVIMPLFAFANAGVSVVLSDVSDMVLSPVMLGIVLGLVVGKPVGITLFTWLAVKIKLITLPENIRWAHIYGIGQLAGIGFTMSLFIADLAMNLPENLMTAKIAIILASLLSGGVGWLLLIRLLPTQPAEVSTSA